MDSNTISTYVRGSPHMGIQRAAIDLLISRNVERRFQTLISKPFIRTILFEKDLNIVCRLERKGNGVYEIKINTCADKDNELLINVRPLDNFNTDNTFESNWSFLISIINKVNPRINEHPFLHYYMQRFHLNVYFEYHRHFIINNFEQDLNSSVYTPAVPELLHFSNFKMKCSATFWRAFNHCFHPEIFVAHLHEEFTELSSMLVSRYIRFVEEIVNFAAIFHGEDVIVSCLSDVNVLKSIIGVKIMGKLNTSVYSIMVNEHTLPKVNYAAINNEQRFVLLARDLRRRVISIEMVAVVKNLEQIATLPNLYMFYNRYIPHSPCPYVRTIVDDVKAFHRKNKLILRDYINLMNNLLIQKIAMTYNDKIIAVLQEHAHNAGMDLAKVQCQLRMDINYFIIEMRKFSLKPDIAVMVERLRRTTAEGEATA